MIYTKKEVLFHHENRTESAIISYIAILNSDKEKSGISNENGKSSDGYGEKTGMKYDQLHSGISKRIVRDIDDLEITNSEVPDDDEIMELVRNLKISLLT